MVRPVSNDDFGQHGWAPPIVGEDEQTIRLAADVERIAALEGENQILREVWSDVALNLGLPADYIAADLAPAAAALNERAEKAEAALAKMEAGRKLNAEMSERFNVTHRLKQTLARHPTPEEVDAVLAAAQETDPE